MSPVGYFCTVIRLCGPSNDNTGGNGRGLPIIATNVGGVPDIVKENGILIEYPEVDSLANAMVCLAEDAELRLKMGRISSLMAEQYDIRKVTAQYEALYEKYAGPR